VVLQNTLSPVVATAGTVQEPMCHRHRKTAEGLGRNAEVNDVFVEASWKRRNPANSCSVQASNDRSELEM